MSVYDLLQSPGAGLVLSAIAALIGGLFGLSRWLLIQSEKRLDLRFAAMEEARKLSQQQWMDQFEALGDAQERNEQRTVRMLSELPLQYQRREDAIRAEVAIIARLDALGEKVCRALECDIRHCPIKEVLHDR
ncbi:MAG: hypothetical protein JNK95_04930 [Candidatus Competibacter sp.]|nr:hypothetical protein [Candidatus Competibacter sp.]MDG4606459.1 hypothetical protein [Candidatus Contendobacter sp.]MDS4059289.1 hypothetical protein [Candidatus Contendobacter sp.]HRD49784.1 hypothetical protein [Candidatus Contendobacter sp.]